MELLLYAKAVPTSATTPANLAGYTAGRRWVATRAGSLQRITLMLTDAVTADSLVGTVNKNGTVTVLSVTLNTAAPLLGNKTGPGISYLAGDLLELEMVNSGLADTTADSLGIIQGA